MSDPTGAGYPGQAQHFEHDPTGAGDGYDQLRPRDDAPSGDEPGDELEADELEQRDEATDVSPGDVVGYRYVDRYTGTGDSEVVQPGIVLGTDPDTGLVRVVLFDNVSEVPAGDLEAI